MRCAEPKKCRIMAVGPSMTTMAYYPPIYDGHGNNVNPDMNTTTHTTRCLTCGKEFVERWCNGITETKIVKGADNES